MRKLLLAIMTMATLGVSAQQEPEWKNPQVNQMNRESRRAHFFAYETQEFGTLSVDGRLVAFFLC